MGSEILRFSQNDEHMGSEILRFSQNDELNDTLFISAVVVLRGKYSIKLLSRFQNSRDALSAPNAHGAQGVALV